ncbi:right-handed parallel beta-helix repeat-containing protein [Streptomyces sp. NK08204]|uniref:right-handed parallel beta-helix repeat-containing protein n=1 Tax=Streptomyces sp. NK08204 TaxID=2873260 RepID=UPI001CECB5E5|nr:right-handed parallel beta-helix repeat-containing protein [Streptomyces sp. NK08204]
MTKRHITYLACTTALLSAALGTTPASAAHRTLVVHPGESIQKAVNAARPGDTVIVLGGTYHESVTVKTPGVTLRGVGPRTVIMPTDAQKAAAANAQKAPASSAAKKASVSCLEGGNGICVVGAKDTALRDVTVADLTLKGFPRIGLWSMGTDRLTVKRVTSDNNGQWGIAQEHSTRGVFRQNIARNNGDAGLFLANNVKAEEGATDTRGAVVDRNYLEGNRIGITVRRLRNLSVTRNAMTGNCSGVFVVGDENKPKTRMVTVSDNLVEHNNKYCAKTARMPFLQGSGIILTGVDDTLVRRNLVIANSGKSPLSGGIVLFKSMVGVASERNRITGNWLADNSPADLVNQESAKSRNTFPNNFCRASQPAGLC